MTAAIGAYFFLLALVLAHLEIEIEGPHGWAEKLPTRRWDGPGIRRWLGKPVTGYHFCLLTLLLLFLHLPQFYGASWEREADLLAMFFLLTVTWDFLWFACNPHFGVVRFREGQVWWFPAWTFGVPRPYLIAIALSVAAALSPAVWTGAWVDRVHRWAVVFGELLGLTVLVMVITFIRRRGETALRGRREGQSRFGSRGS
jgi:hypothetical protein